MKFTWVYFGYILSTAFLERPQRFEICEMGRFKEWVNKHIYKDYEISYQVVQGGNWAVKQD